jgi:hypothetical protein
VSEDFIVIIFNSVCLIIASVGVVRHCASRVRCLMSEAEYSLIASLCARVCAGVCAQFILFYILSVWTQRMYLEYRSIIRGKILDILRDNGDAVILKQFKDSKINNQTGFGNSLRVYCSCCPYLLTPRQSYIFVP